MKTAIVHDWLVTYGGAERVLEEILALFPQADLFTLCDFLPENRRGFLGERRIHTSFIQKLPLARKKYRSYLPLMPFAVEQFDLSEYDLVISSSHAVAKGVLTNIHQLHLTYLNNIMIYAWDLQNHYLRSGGLMHGLKGTLARAILHYIRLWDTSSARRPDHYLANSRYMAKQVRKIYGADSTVIYPPVDLESFAICEQKDDYFVIVSRLVPFKRIEIAVQAFGQLPDKKLVVIGDGPQMPTLKALATPNVEFIGFCDKVLVSEYVRRAAAFIFCSVEPFGIAMVEALACGTPVIAYGRGAAPEIVMDGRNGFLFEEHSPAGLRQAIENFESQRAGLDSRKIRATAERFGKERFRQEFLQYVHSAVEAHYGSPCQEPLRRLHMRTVPCRPGERELINSHRSILPDPEEFSAGAGAFFHTVLKKPPLQKEP